MSLVLILIIVLLLKIERLKIESKPIIYITTNEGLTSHLFQIIRLWGKAQVVGRSIIVVNFTSYHYPDVNLVNICDLFMLPESIICTNISSIDIVKKHNCIIIQNKDHWSGKPIDYMLPENTTNNPYFNVADVDCVAGHMRRVDGVLPKGHQMIPSCKVSISKYYYNMLPSVSKDLNLSTQNLVVLHWRRGDQLQSRCIQRNSSIHNVVRDKSVNCHSVEEFINLTKGLLIREKIPSNASVLVATNEISPQQLDTLHNAGYKTMTLLKNSINYQNLTSLDLFMLDLTMMMESTWFFGWGTTEIQSFVQNILNRKSINGKFAYYNNMLDY